MAVAFAVCRNVHEARAGIVFREAGQKPVGEILAIVEQALKGHGAGYGAVVEKRLDGLARRQGNHIGPAGVDVPFPRLPPLAVRQGAHALGLTRGQEDKDNAKFGQHLQRFKVHSRFRQPHPFWLALEAVFEVFDSPKNLRVFVAPIGQGQDHVVIRLGQGRAMAGEGLQALPVGLQDGLVGIRGVVLNPGQQRRPEVETDPSVIVD